MYSDFEQKRRTFEVGGLSLPSLLQIDVVVLVQWKSIVSSSRGTAHCWRLLYPHECI